MSLQPSGPKVDSEECQRILGDIFREFFDNEDLLLHPDMTARDIDGWDSLANIRLLLTIERKFQVKFSASEVGSLQKLSDLVSLVSKKKGWEAS